VFFVVVREFLVLRLAELHLIVFGIIFILVVLFMSGGLVGVWAKFQTKLARRSERKKTGDAPQQASRNATVGLWPQIKQEAVMA